MNKSINTNEPSNKEGYHRITPRELIFRGEVFMTNSKKAQAILRQVRSIPRKARKGVLMCNKCGSGGYNACRIPKSTDFTARYMIEWGTHLPTCPYYPDDVIKKTDKMEHKTIKDYNIKTKQLVICFKPTIQNEELKDSRNAGERKDEETVEPIRKLKDSRTITEHVFKKTVDEFSMLSQFISNNRTYFIDRLCYFPWFSNIIFKVLGIKVNASELGRTLAYVKKAEHLYPVIGRVNHFDKQRNLIQLKTGSSHVKLTFSDSIDFQVGDMVFFVGKYLKDAKQKVSSLTPYSYSDCWCLPTSYKEYEFQASSGMVLRYPKLWYSNQRYYTYDPLMIKISKLFESIGKEPFRGYYDQDDPECQGANGWTKSHFRVDGKYFIIKGNSSDDPCLHSFTYQESLSYIKSFKKNFYEIDADLIENSKVQDIKSLEDFLQEFCTRIC